MIFFLCDGVFCSRVGQLAYIFLAAGSRDFSRRNPSVWFLSALVDPFPSRPPQYLSPFWDPPEVVSGLVMIGYSGKVERFSAAVRLESGGH